MVDKEIGTVISFADRRSSVEEEREITDRDIRSIHDSADRILHGEEQIGFRLEPEKIEGFRFPDTTILFSLTKKDDVVAFLLRGRIGNEVIARLEGRTATILMVSMGYGYMEDRNKSQIEPYGDSNGDRVSVMSHVLNEVARFRS